jgi:ABC-type sugar transport system ATPase subunit
VVREPVLEARGITKRFPGTVALNKVDLTLFPGQIHALMGENGAGKSTLLGILTGALQPDEGELLLHGQRVVLRSPDDALRRGIAIVHQELSLFPELSVLENVLIGRVPSRFGIMRRRQAIQLARDYFAGFGFEIDVSAPVRTLSVSQQQIVEIVKVLSSDADVLIFDEPTSSLSVEAAQKLFDILEQLRRQGKAIVYVSHKFDEIFRLADHITVLRDGHRVGSAPASDLDADEVIRWMVGRSLEHVYPAKSSSTGDVVLRVRGMNAGPRCRDVSFELKKGEILGFFGLIGSGRSEMMRALCGIDRKSSGEVELDGRPVEIRTLGDAIRHGLYYLTEDRKNEGLFLKMDILDNLAVTHLKELTRRGLLNRRGAQALAERGVHDLRVKASSVRQLVGHLSGGNQQKVMIAKWLTMQPRVVILDEPTRGIDVGAKSEIHHLLRRLANQGIGVIVISSELPEIVGLSDRVLVVHNGAIVGELTGDDIRDEVIMQYASGLSVNTR